MTMTDAELIEILRSSANRVVNYAGDRIEQLERELSISRRAQVVMDNSVEALTAERDKYEAAWMTAEGKLADAEAERDKAYANGYSDAETEISKSVLGQRNAFLHSQYANAADRIEALTANLQVSNELGRALEEDAGQLREDNARLRDALARMANEINVVGSEYDKAAKALDGVVSSIKQQARAALTGKADT
jgi:chromosome segregation ATPase